jgi:ubiquinone/menaquinone biosynthesis C-methylase UbiE
MSQPSRLRFETPQRAWEAAYARFEGPTAELKKFSRRLRRAGVTAWNANSRVLEMFSGRGGGVRALKALGFRHVTAVDLSRSLLVAGERPAILADCRALPCGSGTQDAVVIQGGLHHLNRLPEDLDQTLEESWRVLAATGKIVIIEPWSTPFLHVVHALCTVSLVRRLSPRVEALATMIEHERRTYEQWLANSALIRTSLLRWFEPERWQVAWGKLLFVGTRRRVV